MPQDVFSSREILKIRESFGDSAVWQYHPRSDKLLLSDAANRMLDPNGAVDADLSSLVNSLRCEDGFSRSDFRDALVSGLLDGKSFEVARSREAARVLMMRYQRLFAPDGRSERIDGLFIDVTAQHDALRMMGQRRRCAIELFEKIGYFEWQTDGPGRLLPSTEWLALTGQPLKDQPLRWQEMIAPESRQEIAEAVARATSDPSGGFYAQFSLRTVGGETAHFIGSGALVGNDLGLRREMSGRVLRRDLAHEGKVGLKAPAAAIVASGPELRAARALLGWSMQDMAAAAEISVSTVKRLEDGEISIRASNMARVVQALQAGGVSFLMADRGRIGVALRGG